MKHRQNIEVRKGSSKGVLNSDGHGIGLDIGATAVRAAILAPGVMEGRRYVTTHGMGSVDLPPGAVLNGVIVDAAAVTRAIKRLWAENKFECKNVVLGIATPQVVVREHEMPRMTPDHLAKALPYQAREIVAIPIDQAILDFIPIGVQDEDRASISGLLVGVPKIPVTTAVNAVERAGLKVARVDLSAFGLLRAAGGSDETIEVVIDLGAQLTTIVVHVGGAPRVIRTVSRGSRELTERIADRAGIELAEAELAKCLNGLSGSDERITSIVNDGIRPLLAEIRTSVQFFSSTHGNATPGRVCLAGGGSNLPGLTEILAEQLGIPTMRVEPMQHVANRWAPETQNTSPAHAASAISVGLAIGAAA